MICLAVNITEPIFQLSGKMTKYNIDDYKCTLCQNILVEAMQTECGHIFCEMCIVEFIEKEEKNDMQASCPRETEDCLIFPLNKSTVS